MGIFDSLMNPAAVGGAFAEGMKTGRAEREDREVKGALSAYAMNPDDPQAFRTLAQYKPEYAIKIGEDRRKREQQQRLQSLQQRAAAGDHTAMAEMAGVDLDAYLKLDKRTQEKVDAQVDYVGQSALAVKQLPPEQQAAAWEHYIEQGVAMGYPELANQRGKYSPEALDAALAHSKLVKDAITLAKPDYQVIPEGGRLVNTKDPAALSSVAGGGAPTDTPPVQVKSIDEAKRLPPGTRFIDPNGVERQVPGGQTATPSGTFR